MKKKKKIRLDIRIIKIEHIMSRDIRCPKCKCFRFEEDFLKNGRRLKTCIKCRDNSRRYKLKNKCPHDRQKQKCRDCGGIGICRHNRQKYKCIECGGSDICPHNLQRQWCKTCSGPVKVSIQGWIMNTKQSDKKYNRYDADRFIDKCFLKELVKDYPNCYYCEVELQYINNNDTLATIERLDNSVGHIKSNCVLACRKCNLSRERK